jgi:hypothetical protein
MHLLESCVEVNRSPLISGQLWNGRPSDAMMHAAKTQLEKVRCTYEEY